MILRHHSQMHTAGVFLIGIALAAVIAIFAVSKQTSSIAEDMAAFQPKRDDDGS